MFLEALIIDPNPTTRGYLWQATLADIHFNHVKAFSTLDATLLHLQKGYKYDVVLISSTFEREEIGTFIHDAKQSNGGKEAAYVCVLKVARQNTDNIALGMIGGVDGFLFEPFSVESLKQVAAIAARVKSEFERQRKKTAISIYVTDIMKALDAYALACFSQKDVPQAKKQFLKSTAHLRKLKKDELEIYHELALEMFSQGIPRPPISYRGASQRVKQRLKELTVQSITKKES